MRSSRPSTTVPTGLLIFQSIPSHEKWRDNKNPASIEMLISIHTPSREVTAYSLSFPRHYPYFNPHSRMRSDQYASRRSTSSVAFQSALSYEKWLLCGVMTVNTSPISIRTLVWEVTHTHTITISANGGFQSALSYEKWLKTAISCSSITPFQSALSYEKWLLSSRLASINIEISIRTLVWEVTSMRWQDSLTPSHFNPHSRMRSDVNLINYMVVYMISIRTLVWEVTV